MADEGKIASEIIGTYDINTFKSQDVPITWSSSRAVLPCVAPLAERLAPRRAPLPLNDDQPAPSRFLWRRDGVEVNHKRVSPTGSLEVSRRGRKEDEGVYQCQVRYLGGWVLGYPTHLKFATLETEFSAFPEDVTARSGQPVALPCSVDSEPAASVSWLKDGQPLTEDKRHHFLQTQLLITDVSEKDQGSYRCIATNKQLNRSLTSAEGRLTVQDGGGEMEAALLPVQQDSDVYAPRGSRVVLPCPVTGWPRPRLIWELFPPGQGRKSELDVVSQVFVIRSLHPDQQGTYTCSLEENRQISKTISVTMTEPVRITIPPTSREVLRAGTVRFNCTAAGWPEPTLTWFKDGEPLQIGTDRINLRKSTDGQQRTELVISGVTTHDAGVYQCFVSNVASTASSWALLNVTGADAAAPGNVRCWPMGDRLIKITWDEPPNQDLLAYTLQGTSEDEKAASSLPLHPLDKTETEEIAEVKAPFVPYRFQLRSFGKKSTVSDMSAAAVCEGQGAPIRMAKLPGNQVIVSWKQTAEEFPGVVQWLLQTRDRGREDTVTLDGAVHNYTLHVPSTPLQVRVLGSRTLAWLPQDLTLVPWSSTAEAGDSLDYGDVTVVPESIAVSGLSAQEFTVTWQCEEASRYLYLVCVKGEDMETQSCVERKETSATFSNLLPGTEYRVIIQARLPKRALGGPFSQPVAVTTLRKIPLRFKNLTASYINSTTIKVSWSGPPAHYRVHYSARLRLPVENWTSVETDDNSVLVTAPDPANKTFLMVTGYDPQENSWIYTVLPLPQEAQYESTANGIRFWWPKKAHRTVSFTQNISAPLEHWANKTGEDSILLPVNQSSPTHVMITEEGRNKTQMLTIEAIDLWPSNTSTVQPKTEESSYSWLYICVGTLLGILALGLMSVAAVCIWRKRKRRLSPVRCRRRNLQATDDNVEEEAEMKAAPARRLANGSAGAGAPLLNGYVHITENPTSKTPNGKMRKGQRYEAAFDVSRYEDPDATQETNLDDSSSYNFLDTSRRAELDLARPSRGISANNSFAKLPDDNMNSEMTSAFQLDNSTVQPTLQPNG